MKYFIVCSALLILLSITSSAQQSVATTTLPTISFATGDPNLAPDRPETIQLLKQVLAYITSCSEARVVIEGYAVRSEGLNDEQRINLSKLRAESVRNWLIQNGVPADRIPSVRGFGSHTFPSNQPGQTGPRVEFAVQTACN